MSMIPSIGSKIQQRQSLRRAQSKEVSSHFMIAASEASAITLDQSYTIDRILSEIDWNDRHHVPEDWRDKSVHPSYTNYKVPYHLVCRYRWQQTRETMERQFQKELQQLLEMQPNASDSARFVRYMSYTSLWPPLHNRREIQNTQRYFFRLKPKQRARLNDIMKYKIT